MQPPRQSSGILLYSKIIRRSTTDDTLLHHLDEAVHLEDTAPNQHEKPTFHDTPTRLDLNLYFISTYISKYIIFFLRLSEKFPATGYDALHA